MVKVIYIYISGTLSLTNCVIYDKLLFHEFHNEHIYSKEINVYKHLYMLHLLKCHPHLLMVYSTEIGEAALFKNTHVHAHACMHIHAHLFLKWNRVLQSGGSHQLLCRNLCCLLCSMQSHINAGQTTTEWVASLVTMQCCNYKQVLW
jgi:hypothetical protein